ncbi:MAG TPA: aldo/keto reductase, partial [Caulobacteraceae bacterium]|nr:aldo/keto reductase [Caulobacteraceae bacterium]
KVFNPMGRGPNKGGLSRKHIHQSIDASLPRLGLDYVDLYQIHRFDYATPIEETIEALDDVVKAGKALYIGASSMFAYQFSKYLHLADQMGRARFATMQNHYNLAYREEEREMNPLCLEEGVGLIPWSPLAGGWLAGNRDEGTTRSQSAMGRGRYNRPEDQAVLEALRKVAAARGEPPAQVAIAWLLSKPAVTAPIVGVTKPHHLDAPLAAVEHPLTEEEIAELEAPYDPQAIIGALRPEDLTMRRERAERGPARAAA